MTDVLSGLTKLHLKLFLFSVKYFLQVY